MMKRFLILLALIFTSTVVQAQYGFTGQNAGELKFDDNVRLEIYIKGVSKLIPRKKSGDFNWYSRIGDKKKLEEINLEMVRYGFVNGVLCGVYGKVNDSGRALIEILFHNVFNQSEIRHGDLTLYPNFSVISGERYPVYIQYYDKDGYAAILKGNEFYLYKTSFESRVVPPLKLYY